MAGSTSLSRYQETPLEGWLARRVACRWTQHVAGGPGPYVQRIVPDGCIDVLWLDGALSVAGPDTGPVLAPLRPGSIAAVRFRPGQAPAVLGVPAHELRDGRVHLEDLWGRATTERLSDRLRAAASADEAARLLTREAADRLRAAVRRPAGPLVEGLVAAVRCAAEPLDVAAFADRAGVSERQLRRRCVEAVGYAPKVLDRVLRFQRFLATARRGHGRLSLGQLAAAAGYADQAHLARECRRLGGVTPTELLGSSPLPQHG
jgi:AraC-like DNA-binding protein